jgi:hypothetical protein
MPSYCRGCHPSGRPCRASRVQPGQRATISGACSKCKERRCKAHCRCNRIGFAVGRSAPRGGSGSVAARAASPAAAAAAAPPPPPHRPISLAPVGHPGAPSIKFLSEDTFYPDLLEALDGASQVHIAVFQYDHPKVQEKLLRGLRKGMHLDLVVDKQSRCRSMPTRIKELQDAGGNICFRSGHNHRESMGLAALT